MRCCTYVGDIHVSETGTQLIIIVHIKKKKGKTTIAEEAADEFYILLKRIYARIYIYIIVSHKCMIISFIK